MTATGVRSTALPNGGPGGGHGSGGAAAAILEDPCLVRLDGAIAAARSLGLAVDGAETVRADAAARLGFPSRALVVALVGGTGVGKSSLVNGLAGREVSPASVRRPTTTSPVAWIPAGAADDLGPLLDWLGVAAADVRAGDPAPSGPDAAGTSGSELAILDLPDLDSIEPSHRARVDAALPRVDAVIWVTDPEKYHDALLHDELLTRWLPRLGRQIVVVNKADRLAPADGERLRRDLERDIRRLAAGPGRAVSAEEPSVVLASVVADAADPAAGLDRIRAWLETGADAKRIVRGRLVATIRDTISGLARAAGVDPGAALVPLLGPAARTAAIDAAGDALLRVVDLPSLRRQAVAATRARARSRGAGPLGGLTSRIFRWSGREARVADPAAYLARWRDRGTPGAAAGLLRAALAEPLRTSTPDVRRGLAAAAEPAALEAALGSAVDRAIATDPGTPPTSRWWSVIGLGQTVATGAIVLSAIWVGLWIAIRFPTDVVRLPLVGQVPLPFVALVASLVAGYLLARLLGLHAGWLGRRWADRLADRVRGTIRTSVAATAFEPIDRLEADRREVWAAARSADCAPVD